MAKFDITYGIIFEDKILATDKICISLTKKDVEELEACIVEHDYSPMFADIPERFYARCCNKALADAPRLCETVNVTPSEDVAVAFSEVLPLCLADALSEPVATQVKAKMHERLPELFADQAAQ